jgi:MoxR-like ATPase
MSQQNVPGVDPMVEQQCEAFRRDYKLVQQEIGKAIVGHEDIIDGVLTCLFTGGHALLEGVPGLGKTALIRALSEALHLKFGRIQFTPDLMPADIIGTKGILEDPSTGQSKITFLPGPIFNQIVLADEINRAIPKTQSAMLEAMQEKQVTLFGDIRKLAPPFFVMATQNPLEQEGTYPLPEAQLDRFFYKLVVQYSGRQELHEILNRTTTSTQTKVSPVLDAERIIAHQQLVRRVVIAPHVQDYAIRVTLATHPQGMYAIPMTNQFLRVGASPRAAQTITLASKVRALLDGRFHVSFKDIKEVLVPAMRHRVILNFEGEAEGITTDMVLEKIMAEVPTTIEGEAPVGAGR